MKNMDSVSVLVVEDESIVRKDIQNSLKKLNYSVSGACSKGEDAIDLARQNAPDVVLMDIMLKGNIGGIEAATTINNDLNIPVIFLTAYADESTLEKAKSSDPYGYILKPFKEIELKSAIEMAINKHNKFNELIQDRNRLYSLSEEMVTPEKDVLFVKNQGKLVRVDFKDIYFIEALKDYVVINTTAARYTIHSTMKEIEKRIHKHDFIRAHRSFIVRTDKITTIENNNIYLLNDKKIIPIGGLYRSELYKRLNIV
jgi:DNA-binding LytR/AlgR family response regulator